LEARHLDRRLGVENVKSSPVQAESEKKKLMRSNVLQKGGLVLKSLLRGAGSSFDQIQW
jgi:hypothetical protein